MRPPCPNRVKDSSENLADRCERDTNCNSDLRDAFQIADELKAMRAGDCRRWGIIEYKGDLGSGGGRLKTVSSTAFPF